MEEKKEKKENRTFLTSFPVSDANIVYMPFIRIPNSFIRPVVSHTRILSPCALIKLYLSVFKEKMFCVAYRLRLIFSRLWLLFVWGFYCFSFSVKFHRSFSSEDKKCKLCR